MVVNHLPVIKVLDVSTIPIPLKVTVTRRTDGKLWWKYTNVVPDIMHDFSTIKIADTGIADRMEAYKFSQCLYNLLLYNNLQLDMVQKFVFTYENDMSTFIYFIDEDEVIIVPMLPCHGQSLKFTLYENKYPILKLQTKPE
jgi:hypothetical protein